MRIETPVKKLVIGTFNQDKAREIGSMLAGVPVEVRLLSDYEGLEEVPEDGETLQENAEKKALGLARQIGEVVMADDSGLEVDALDGEPGVRSARYAGPGADYAAIVAKLLREMKNVPQARRTGRFRCCICMGSPDGVLLRAEGRCEGRIAALPRGTNGFGYDPVFVPAGHARTFAQMSPEEKNRLSHRGAAVRAFRKELGRFLDEHNG